MQPPIRRVLAVLTMTALACSATAFLPNAASASASSDPSHASFEGRTIDLRQGWGSAKACASDGETTTCFRSEAAMDDFIGRQRETESSSRGSFGTLSSCASPVRLYDNTGFGTPVLSLYSRGSWLNLSAYGFDAQTASYIIGDCAAYFADGTSGSGTWYPGDTSAYASSSDMGASWRDRVSSVYLT